MNTRSKLFFATVLLLLWLVPSAAPGQKGHGAGQAFPSDRHVTDAMRSVPPRGSGWVSFRNQDSRMNNCEEPTRYRVVVLTSLLNRPLFFSDPKLPTLFVIGDSTANNNANGARGWGDPFVGYFDPAKINVLNRARAGRSSRTFFAEGLWEKVLQEMKPGDFVLIEFGHNDGGPLDTGRARGSLFGTGEET